MKYSTLAILAIAMSTNGLARQPFKGVIHYSARDSQPAWPDPAKAPEGAPNIILVLLDDVGFGDTSTFGGLIDTPNFDKLAAAGAKYNRFHTTAACSPTRAALLSGRNHHRMGFGIVLEHGYPGYNAIWKKSTVSIPEVLRRSGYSTAAFGKWHNTPSWEISPVGPFDRWPTHLGFEYFFGNMRGNGSQWQSRLWRNTTEVEVQQNGRHLTEIIVDDAARWLRQQRELAPNRPYFLYLATEAVHSPHHAPKAWIDKYKGRFDVGWDEFRRGVFLRQKRMGIIPQDAKLTARPAELPAWDALSADQKRLYARQMEVYAGFLSHTDHELGRLFKLIDTLPGRENTLIMLIIGDNGAEGWAGPEGTDDLEGRYRTGKDRTLADQLSTMDQLGSADLTNLYSAGWAWAGNTPFPWVKHVASHLGGIRNPLIVNWPGHIAAPDVVRTQFIHVNDVAATIYAAARIRFPDKIDGVKQLPLDGPGFFDTFMNPSAPQRHHIQYFEQEGSRAIYKDGWLASARLGVPWLRAKSRVAYASHVRASERELRSVPWELYDLRSDFSQADDIARAHPGKLKSMKRLFDREAKRNGVYPLDPGLGMRNDEQ